MKIKINSKEYRFFSRYSLNLRYNAIASLFDFTIVNEIDAALKYLKIEIFDDNNDLLLTGTIINANKVETPQPESLQISGYSLPGVLEDCTIPIELYPLQSDKLSLLQITDKILKPFGLTYTYAQNIEKDLQKTFEKSISGISMPIKMYLNQLASQRGIILTHNQLGQLIYTRFTNRSKGNRTVEIPVQFFDESEIGSQNISLNINAQQMHSEITVLRQASHDNPDAAQHTITNPYVDEFRPSVKKLNSGDLFDVKAAARNALSAELAFIVFTIKTTKFIKPGSTIELLAPSIGVNEKIELFVQETLLEGKVKGADTVVLTCVLIDVYTNDEVKKLF